MKIDTIDILICAKMTQQIKLSHIDIGIAGERSHRMNAWYAIVFDRIRNDT